MEDLMKIDLYELLNISVKAEEKEIKKAYRKKALTCHPDKNPDNPKAAELFQQLTKAIEVLTNKADKAAYDKVLKARKASQIRHRELDSKRKKLKDDLEAREKAAATKEFDKKHSAETLQKEIERLRQGGSKLVEDEKERLRQEVLKEKLGATPPQNTSHNEVMPMLKVRWRSHTGDETNGGYSQETLENFFRKYGQVLCLVSTKKNGYAILEFTSSAAAQLAFESEKGDPQNPLRLSWICGQPEVSNNSRFTRQHTANVPAPEPGKDSAMTFRDYESLVLMKLRQAEERKKLKVTELLC